MINLIFIGTSILILIILQQFLSAQIVQKPQASGQFFTWADAKTIVAAGAVAGVPTAADEITLRKGAGALLGLQYLLVGAIPTSGENGVPILILNSDSIGINNQHFVCNLAKSDGIATNNKEAPVYCGFIPLAYEGELEFADINISVDSSVNVTGGWEGAVGIKYANRAPDAEYRGELMAYQHGPVRGGQRTVQAAGIAAAGETSFTNEIKIPGGFVELRGLVGFVNPNAPTSGEACSGYTNYLSGDIPQFAPQRHVNNVGWDASLGTPVGTPVSASGFKYHPVRFPMTGEKASIEIAQKMAVVLSNAGDGIAGAVYV